MHELLEIKSAEATRRLILKNLETGTVEECFDDSALGYSDNFYFMAIGKTYECKICLFGSVNSEGVELFYRGDLLVGLERMSEVIAATGDVYYVGSDDATGLSLSELSIGTGSTFTFYSTRKDLVQVNDTIHGDCLRVR